MGGPFSIRLTWGWRKPTHWPNRGLGNAARAVDRMVVTVGAVGPGQPADVLGREGISELVGVPELRRYVGRVSATSWLRCRDVTGRAGRQLRGRRCCRT